MTPRTELMSLPASEKLELIEQLWDSLSASEKDQLPADADRSDLARGLRSRESLREAVLREIRQQIEEGARQADAGQFLDGPTVFRQLRDRTRRQ
jgi:predicted transcriptional regulator